MVRLVMHQIDLHHRTAGHHHVLCSVTAVILEFVSGVLVERKTAMIPGTVLLYLSVEFCRDLQL